MAGRPRTTSNDDILAGAARVLARLGPARVALADVGAEVGLAPATLVQRFGSKRGLLLALAEQAAGVARAEFAAARRSEGAPLETLVAVLCAMTRAVSTPEALANSLAFLQLDLREPDFYRCTIEHARVVRTEIQGLLDAAVAAGGLSSCDTARLARAVQVTYNGALVTWAIDREGSLTGRLRDELDLLLRPYRRTDASHGAAPLGEPPAQSPRPGPAGLAPGALT